MKKDYGQDCAIPEHAGAEHHAEKDGKRDLCQRVEKRFASLDEIEQVDRAKQDARSQYHKINSLAASAPLLQERREHCTAKKNLLNPARG